jgi:histidinol dehydrogenase
MVQRRWRPVKRAGIYIPGGRAAYPSTVLMNAIPASVAGVGEIIMVSPGNNEGKINKTVLAAAYLSGINKVFRIGGAQAIGALAFGTNTIDKVDVISGPGNIYVTTAKKLIYGSTGIDSLAGPSEILIIADQTAQSKLIASDLLAQAEHDPLASSILLTTSKVQAMEVSEEIYKKIDDHPRKEICLQSIKNWGLIVICDNYESCIELSNIFAPEHLEILAFNPNKFVEHIENAGAIFIGKWTPEAVGDYLAGPNHTLPTSGNARFSGSLGVETFMKNTSIIEFSEESLKVNSLDIMNLANSEGLHSHANSVQIRFND